jgi:hypothetical protein
MQHVNVLIDAVKVNFEGSAMEMGNDQAQIDKNDNQAIMDFMISQRNQFYLYKNNEQSKLMIKERKENQISDLKMVPLSRYPISN